MKPLKFFRITFLYGDDECSVTPLGIDPETVRKSFRLHKRTGDRNTYDVRLTDLGPICNRPGFHYRRRCNVKPWGWYTPARTGLLVQNQVRRTLSDGA